MNPIKCLAPLPLLFTLGGCAGEHENQSTLETLAQVKTRDDCYLLYVSGAKTTVGAKLAKTACDNKFREDFSSVVRSVAGVPPALDHDWVAVASSEKYRNLPPEKRKIIQTRFFEDTVSFRVAEDQRDAALRYWVTWTDQIDASLLRARTKESPPKDSLQ